MATRGKKAERKTREVMRGINRKEKNKMYVGRCVISGRNTEGWKEREGAVNQRRSQVRKSKHGRVVEKEG